MRVLSGIRKRHVLPCTVARTNSLVRDGAILDFLLPRRIRPDLFSFLIMKTPDILSHIKVVRFPVVKMAEEQMMIPALDFA